MPRRTSKLFKLGEAGKSANESSASLQTVEQALKLDLIAFGPDGFAELSFDSVAALGEQLGKYPVNWINVEAGSLQGLQPLAALFNLHELALEDALNFHQRPKVDDYEDQIFVVLRAPVGHGRSYDTEQISLFIGKNHVISFQEKSGGDCLNPVRDRIRKGAGNIRTLGADYLAYSIIDAGIDAYFPLLEQLGDRIENLDEMVLSENSKSSAHHIHRLKLEVLAIRRAVWPMRDTINLLCRDISPFIGEHTRLYMRDCYDHLSRIIDIVEIYRELSNDFLNLYLSMVNNRMNEIIKVLTVITSLFIPPTFIAGIYGMNFNTQKSPFNMPELNWYFGYPFCIVLMLLTGLLMFIFLKRKGWL